MSKKDEKEKVEVKQPEETAIAPRYPGDIFQAFDEMWEDFRRDFLWLWRPLGVWGRLGRRGARPAALVPRAACTDLIDTGNAYQVCAEVPGIPKDKLDITVTKDEIEISGKAEIERTEDAKGYVVRERGYSEIHRRMAFPEEVVPENAEATLQHGLLEITVPKKMPTPEVKKHKVEVK